MGETAELRNQQAGTFGFNDFISQGDGAATIRKMLRTLLPVVDMRDFQRKYRFSSGDQTLQIGEVLRLDFTVPANEHWRPRSFMFTNKDSLARDMLVIFTVDLSAANEYRAVKTTVGPGSSQIIYGQDLDAGVNAIGEFTSLLPIIMEPTHVMTVRMTGGVAVISEQSWIFVYELVPAPAESLTRGIAAAVTVT